MIWDEPGGQDGIEPMNEDWRAGDLAQCINGDWPKKDGRDPREGDVLRVSAVFKGMDTDGKWGFGLRFEGKPQHRAWWCGAFRKLRPVNVPADMEFTELLRDAIGPKVDA